MTIISTPENQTKKSSPSEATARTQPPTARRMAKYARESPRTSVSTNLQHTQVAIPSTSPDCSSWKDSHSTGAFIRSEHQDVVIDLKELGGWIEPGLLAVDGPVCWNSTSSQHYWSVDAKKEDLLSVGGWISPNGSSPYEHTSAFTQVSGREDIREAAEDWSMIEHWKEETGRGGGPWNAVKGSLPKDIVERGNRDGQGM